MDPSRIAPALGGLLALDAVELLKYLDRDREVVVLKLENRFGVVKENIRVEHEGLNFDHHPVSLT